MNKIEYSLGAVILSTVLAGCVTDEQIRQWNKHMRIPYGLEPLPTYSELRERDRRPVPAAPTTPSAFSSGRSIHVPGVGWVDAENEDVDAVRFRRTGEILRERGTLEVRQRAWEEAERNRRYHEREVERRQQHMRRR